VEDVAEEPRQPGLRGRQAVALVSATVCALRSVRYVVQHQGERVCLQEVCVWG
jgi:hypothetical protein